MLRYLLCIIKFALDSSHYILIYCIAEPKGHVEGKAHKTALLQWERQSTTDATIGETITEIQKKNGYERVSSSSGREALPPKGCATNV